MSNFPLKDFYKKIYKRYDLVNTLFTFGQDGRWRKIAAGEIQKSNPGEVLDLCCGTGKFTFTINSFAQGKQQITGYDFSAEMLDKARETAKETGVENINFIQGDVVQMPFKDETFDAIGVSFGFRNLTYNNENENQHISEIYRVLKKGSSLYILESGSPQNLIIKAFYVLFLFIFLVPLGGILTGNFKAYYYLAVSSRSYYSRRQMMVLLKGFGFNKVSVRKFLFGATNLTIAEK